MTKSSSHEHKQIAAEQHETITLAIITVSDTRTKDTDVNGKYLQTQIAEMGHKLALYEIIKDEPAQVAAVLETAASGPAQVILFNGGTGISKRDNTFDALSRKLEKTLPGFGEIFRMLSYEQIGSAAMFSRATAGVYKGKVVVSTPGSPAAVELAWEKLVAPELRHLAYEVGR
jgi:molybdenum cofactor biosynthesis protein B